MCPADHSLSAKALNSQVFYAHTPLIYSSIFLICFLLYVPTTGTPYEHVVKLITFKNDQVWCGKLRFGALFNLVASLGPLHSVAVLTVMPV